MFYNAPEWFAYVGPVSMVLAAGSAFLLIRINNRKARERSFSLKRRSRPLSMDSI